VIFPSLLEKRIDVFDTVMFFIEKGLRIGAAQKLAIDKGARIFIGFFVDVSAKSN
jgi:hypothetical protein